MSLHPTEVPEVLVKPGKMFNLWSSKLKIALFLVGLAVYVYILLLLKTAYMRSKRLDNIANLASQNEKLMTHIQRVDQNLAMRVNQIRDLYEDY